MAERYSVSEELARKLAELEKKTGYSPEEILARSVALYDYALDKGDPKGDKTVTLKVGNEEQQIKL